MKTSAAILLPFLSVLLGASASAQPARRPVDALPGRVVDVAAGEYFLRAPDSIPAGLVTFRLSQVGDRLTNPAKVEAENLAPATPDNDPTRAFHMLWVARLEPGRTLSEWYAAHVKGEPTPWAVELGGPAAAEPPRTSHATMVLEPGNCEASGTPRRERATGPPAPSSWAVQPRQSHPGPGMRRWCSSRAATCSCVTSGRRARTRAAAIF